MLARVTAFVVWGLVAATAVFWGLRLAARPLAAPPHTQTAVDGGSAGADLSRLFGRADAPPSAAAPAPPELASRFKLVGVMAPKLAQPGGAGVALLASDGKPARPFRPGATVDGDLVLQSVGLRTAALGPARGATVLTLEVPRTLPGSTPALPALVPTQLPAVPPGAKPVPQAAPAVQRGVQAQ